jgi:energy-coupling factor transport system permease protein
MTSRHRLPRPLHPGAWWLWALGMATAASRTTDLALLGLILAVVAFVVSARRSEAPWARGFKYYLWMALVVIGLRVVFRALLDGSGGTRVLFTLPEIPLPEAAAGIRIGGPVAAESLLAALRDGLRLATLLLCLGAANVLANPKRLLASVPGALHELGVAVTVALSVAPQLVESAQRVHRARRLRGDGGRRLHVLRDVVVPVLSDALDRSLLLAAAMDSRGYGRRREVTSAARTTTGVLLVVGLCGVCVGVYGSLDGSAPRGMGLPMLLGGVAVAGAGMVLASRRVHTTRYRPDPWALPEWGVSACGMAVGAALVMIARVDPVALNPSPRALGWSAVPLVAVLAVLVGALPAWIAPPVPRPAVRRRARPDEPTATAASAGPSGLTTAGTP